MSIKVLKAKAQTRRLVTKKNSKASMPVNLYYTGNKSLCCEKAVYQKKKPAPQKSYGNYNRQTLLGYSGLARRVVSLKNSQTNAIIPDENNGGIPERNTFKRMPDFSQSQYLKNKGNCDIREDKCDPVIPVCVNGLGNNMDKRGITITKDIGFLSEAEYLKQKIIKRITPKDHNNNCPDKCTYELPLAPAPNGKLTC